MKALSAMVLAFGLLALPAHAAVQVFACEPEWAALAAELGGEQVAVFSATTAQQDPHRIEARPSLIARLRGADLLVCTGAELEIGWLPMLLRQAGNRDVQPGRPGHFMAADFVDKLDVPAHLDRAHGDVHASGNPHVHADPRRIALIAEALAARLAEIDRDNAATYAERQRAFAARWQEAIARWERQGAPLRGVGAVTHHRDWVYLFEWLGLVQVAELEPKPGIPASAAHLAALQRQLQARPARMVLRTPYQDPRPANWLSERTGLPVMVLPYTVGGAPEAQDLFALFDATLARLLQAIQ